MTIHLPSVNAPTSIKQCLSGLSRNIKLDRESSKGVNGFLFFGVNRVTRARVAIKFYYWGGDRTFHIEPRALAEINSPNVLPVLDAGFADQEYAYFVTPYCEQGDVDDLLGTTSIGNLRAVDLTCQILDGLTHLHQRRFLHRDLKPANIYITDQQQAVIGDFGSIKRLPDGYSSVPGSKHSILYRPPESVESNEYGFSGDVYQAGMVLYQLLGGSLPYDETAWLSKAELKHYRALRSAADQSIFVDQCLKTTISRGRVLDLSTLPPWVPDQLRRVIRKACRVDLSARYRTASEFRIKLHDTRHDVFDWEVVDGNPTCRFNRRTYRIVDQDGVLIVQKSTGYAWRRDNTIQGNSLAELCASIECIA